MKPHAKSRATRILGCLRNALVGAVLLLVALAGFGFWALRATLPAEPRLPGRIERGTLEHGGRTRTWIAYLPTKPQAHPALILVLHASMGTAERARRVFGYDFDELAEEHGFLAVYPHDSEGRAGVGAPHERHRRPHESLGRRQRRALQRLGQPRARPFRAGEYRLPPRARRARRSSRDDADPRHRPE